MNAETKILKRLRLRLMVRLRNIELRFHAADRQRNVFKAAELQAEQAGVSWAIHDLDYMVEGLKWKK